MMYRTLRFFAHDLSVEAKSDNKVEVTASLRDDDYLDVLGSFSAAEITEYLNPAKLLDAMDNGLIADYLRSWGYKVEETGL